MVNIQKYNCVEDEYGNPTMRDTEDGEYVETIHYAALFARHTALKEAILQIREYANGQNWKSIVNMVNKVIAKENK